MRHKLCQIIWHGKEPVFSVDFHRSGILASAGGDKDIKVGASCLPLRQPAACSCYSSPWKPCLSGNTLCAALDRWSRCRGHARGDAPDLAWGWPQHHRQLCPLFPDWCATSRARACICTECYSHYWRRQSRSRAVQTSVSSVALQESSSLLGPTWGKCCSGESTWTLCAARRQRGSAASAGAMRQTPCYAFV